MFPFLYDFSISKYLDTSVFQDSFYHDLSDEELEQVQDYNFDHPGECTFGSVEVWT